MLKVGTKFNPRTESIASSEVIGGYTVYSNGDGVFISNSDGDHKVVLDDHNAFCVQQILSTIMKPNFGPYVLENGKVYYIVNALKTSFIFESFEDVVRFTSIIMDIRTILLKEI